MESRGDYISSDSDGHLMGSKGSLPRNSIFVLVFRVTPLQGSPALSSSVGDAPTGNSAGDRVWWAGVRVDAAGTEKGTTAPLPLGVLAEQAGSSSGGLGRGVWPARS